MSYPVIGAMTKDLYPEYGLSRKNLMRTMLDTGTGLAPMVPWSTTGSYTAGTLGVANMAFIPFAPMLWLSILSRSSTPDGPLHGEVRRSP